MTAAPSQALTTRACARPRATAANGNRRLTLTAVAAPGLMPSCCATRASQGSASPSVSPSAGYAARIHHRYFVQAAIIGELPAHGTMGELYFAIQSFDCQDGIRGVMSR